MFLNQGKFRQNGGCGYVLKPEVMRNPSSDGIYITQLSCVLMYARVHLHIYTEYTPHIDEPLNTVTPIHLEITVSTTSEVELYTVVVVIVWSKFCNT